MNKKHTQLPNGMTLEGDLTPKDLLVYVTIKSHMNKDTKNCYPALDTIVKESGVSKPTVIKSISKLEEKNYLKVSKKGRSNLYSFSSCKNFEPFADEFLKSEDISTNEKAYLIASQQVMFKDLEGYGKISYSDSELSQIINLDKRSIAKYNKSLQEKGFLSIIPTESKDEITGIRIDEKIFYLNKLGQKIIWALQKHEEDIEELKEVTEENSKGIEILLDRISQLEKEHQIQKNLTDTLIDKFGLTKQEVEEINDCKNDEIQL